MSEENKAIVRRFFEEFVDNRDLSIADELLATDFVDHDPAGPNQGPGREGLKQLFAARWLAFPDVGATVEDQVSEGDKVVSRVTITGTNQGEFMGIPATGKSFSIEAIAIFRLEDGKIVERWAVTDNMGMMQQLGVIPKPGE